MYIYVYIYTYTPEVFLMNHGAWSFMRSFTSVYRKDEKDYTLHLRTCILS